jgi:hypothetical protein
MTKKNRNINPMEEPEFGVDSRYRTKKEQKDDAVALMAARLQRLNRLSANQISKARLLQLKLNMEEYIKDPTYKKHHFFTEFLTMYIDILYAKRSAFAKDIGITPVFLSQVLNNHREPKEEFMLRLMIHSEKTFQNVCKFQKTTWYQVYYQEKICDTMSSQHTWRPLEEKHVQFSGLIKN